MIPRQAICAVCGEKVGPGKGTVLSYGAGGRAHTIKCQMAQVRPKRQLTPEHLAKLAAGRLRASGRPLEGPLAF